MMDMHARNEYLKALMETYVKAAKKEKGQILDEYCRNTGQNRKYVIHKIWSEAAPKERIRKTFYDGRIVEALAKVWEVFDYPCGQRLEPLLKKEVERLRKFGELQISDEVANKLKKISSATIDRKLRHQKEALSLKRKYQKKNHPLLYQKIPVRGNDWDRSLLGQVEIDLVEHCGSSTAGEYINSVSVVDVASGWWEAQAIMGKGQMRSFEALQKIRQRMPFALREIHPDNDTAFINAHLFAYAEKEKIKFSRSRPYKKNDNCFVEQKNSTHVRSLFGHLRYDTDEELNCLNDLYEGQLRLYKNFFQPVMKLKEKIRDKGKKHRKYDIPKTPFERVIESEQISKETQEELKAIYSALNPAELKRKIDAKRDELYQAYQNKHRSSRVIPDKKQTPRLDIYLSLDKIISVRNYMTEQSLVGLGV